MIALLVIAYVVVAIGAFAFLSYLDGVEGFEAPGGPSTVFALFVAVFWPLIAVACIAAGAVWVVVWPVLALARMAHAAGRRRRARDSESIPNVRRGPA